MTDLKILKRLLIRADYNILMYSRTTEMLEPKAGCETQFLEAIEEKEFIQKIIDMQIKILNCILGRTKKKSG